MSYSLCPYHGNAYNPGPCGVCEFIIRQNMTPTPQNVTSRYARNVLVKGRNNEFEILDLKRTYSEVDGLTIGIYYTVMIKELGKGLKKDAAGVTPEQAVHRALEKHGVSFR